MNAIYLVQIRKLNNLRSGAMTAMVFGEDFENWKNQSNHSAFDKADAEAQGLIKHSQLNASDVRVVKVVSTYSSTVNVIRSDREE